MTARHTLHIHAYYTVHIYITYIFTRGDRKQLWGATLNHDDGLWALFRSSSRSWTPTVLPKKIKKQPTTPFRSSQSTLTSIPSRHSWTYYILTHTHTHTRKYIYLLRSSLPSYTTTPPHDLPLHIIYTHTVNGLSATHYVIYFLSRFSWLMYFHSFNFQVYLGTRI